MEKYRNSSGVSGITHYEIGADYIAVRFKHNSDVYVYSNGRVEKKHVARMKKLALSGKGLSTYISQHASVKNNYSIR